MIQLIINNHNRFYFMIIIICTFLWFNSHCMTVVRMTRPEICNLTSQSPLIVVPGDGGSRAYAKLTNSSMDPFLIWVNIRYFLTIASFTHYFALRYNETSKIVYDGPDASIDFPGWGDTWSIENLDSSNHYKTEYFQSLMTQIKQDPYFVSGESLRGAPFDFRKSPHENVEFFGMMKDLIEDTYIRSGNRRVVLLGHSLGSIYSLKFFNLQSESWKKKYVRAFIAASGPFGGAMKALKVEASGDNLGVFVDSPLRFRTVQRTMPSVAYMLPDPRLFSRDEPLIQTPERNYTSYDYEQLFQDMNHTLGYAYYRNSRNDVDGFVGPTGVDEIYCIHGSQIPTPDSLVYSPPSIFHNGFPDQEPTPIYGDGDGTVNMRSLQLCSNWPGAKHIVLPKAEHLLIVKDQRFIDLVKQIIRMAPQS